MPRQIRPVRVDGRLADQLRPVRFQNWHRSPRHRFHADRMGQYPRHLRGDSGGSVPRWMKEQGVTGGWITAEYSMLPYSTLTRKRAILPKAKLTGAPRKFSA